MLELEAGGNNKEYNVKVICNSTVYAKELETGQLLGLYYLVSFQKGGWSCGISTLPPPSLIVCVSCCSLWYIF